MGTKVNIEIVKNDKSDVVFLATGSVPLRNIGGGEVAENHTFSPIQVLEGNAEVGSSVVVIGGRSAGC